MIKNITRKNAANLPNSINQSEAPAPEEIVVDKLRTDLSIFSVTTVETSSGLTGETIESVTPGNRIPKTKKENTQLRLHQ